MIKYFFFAFLFITTFSVSGQSFWAAIKVSDISSRSGEERSIVPDVYKTFRLDVEGLQTYLKTAPMESNLDRKKQDIILDIPWSDGSIQKFKVYESPVMDKGISARYPSIKSYKAYHITDKSKHMRFAVSESGFHAAMSALDGDKYIDPYSNLNTTDYIVYNVKDHRSDAFKGVDLCGVDDEIRPVKNSFMPHLRFAGEVELRVYKVAMACTGEWGKKRITVAKCLADINVMMNRMNQIYEKEMAMRFMLIDDNDKLIFLDPDTDPYQNSDEGKKIVGVNTSKLNAIIPASSYDIGHVLSVCFDIGGVAQGGSACQSNKGNGVTCNNNFELSNIVTRVMAHEVGHQLSASHTWNICTSAADQRAPNTAFEPGSGSTIMSYAGSCGSDNVAGDNDDYFHVGSLDQMYSKTSLGGNAYDCADKVATGNRFPVITMPSKSHVIPISTGFELNASATDEDGDALTYLWEQYDAGELVPLGSSSSNAPLFRSIRPNSSSTRFLPNADKILNGVMTEKTEVAPTNSRNLNFRFIVRDNNPAGSGVVWEDYRISSSSTAGPFSMIYPIIDEKFEVGQEVTVTWNVANTDLAPVNCKLVNIYASINGALRSNDPNMILLATNVPNDGSQVIYVPNKISNFVRIVVKAADNIFLTTSVLNSKIVAPTTPKVYFEPNVSYAKICQPENASFELTTFGLAGLIGDIELQVLSGLPTGAVATFSKTTLAPGEKSNLVIDIKNVVGSQTVDVVIRAIVAGVDTMDRILTINIVGGNLSNLSTIQPSNGQSGVSALPKYIWSKKADASAYKIEVSKSPDFAPANIVTKSELADSSLTSSVILNKASVYYWRVKAVNDCGEGVWSPIQAFITEALACKTYESGNQTINISGSGSPTVELVLNVPNEGSASDVNVKLVKGEHSRTGDLTVFLVAPSGKEVLLWNTKCGTNKNFNVGIDDQSPDFFQCPINTGNVYRPEYPLDVLNGEAIKGNWTLRVEDRKAGEGGKLQEMNLEICSNVVLDQPYLVKNDTLKIHPGNKSFITDALLLAADNNNTAAELIYTLVNAPSTGILTFNGIEIKAGARFSQLELNNSKLRYQASNASAGLDRFSFVVEDGQGGWISITDFNIKQDESFINAVSDVHLSTEIFVMPNPTYDELNIVLTGEAKKLTNFNLTDLAGRSLIVGKIISDQSILSLGFLNSGVYLLKLSDGRNVVTKKVVKI